MATGQENLPNNKGMTDAEVRAMVAGLIKDGRAEDKLYSLFQDNFELRGKNRDLEARVGQLEAAAPKGSVILTADEGKEWEVYKSLGKPAKDVKKDLETAATTAAENATLKRRNTIVEIADAENWKPNVLERLTQNMDLAIEEIEEESEDPDDASKKVKTKVKRGFMNNLNDKGEVTGKKRLSEELSDLLPSLAKQSDDAGEQGVQMPRMSRGDKVATGATKGASTDFINRRYGAKVKKDEAKQ